MSSAPGSGRRLPSGPVEGLFSVIGAATGALIVLIGQAAIRRTDERRGRHAALIEQCAMIIALEEDMSPTRRSSRNRAAASRVLLTSGRR